MTRDEIVQAIEAATARLETLRPLAVQHAEAPLLSGEWRVRDALSHLAARSNAIPIMRRFLERADAAAAGQAAVVQDIHEVNAGQVRDRSGLSVNELIDEMVAGHRATIEAIPGLDDALLERSVPMGATGTIVTVAELVVRAGVGHEGNHLGDIDSAISAAAS